MDSREGGLYARVHTPPRCVHRFDTTPIRTALDDSVHASKILPLVSRMKCYLPFVIVIGVALATFGSGAMLYRAKRPQIQNIPESQRVPAKGDTQSAHIRGNPDAPVTLEEFADF